MTAPAFAVEAGHHHHEQAAAPATLSLDAADKKWTTDAPLRKAMTNIRNAMAKSLHAIHEDKLAAAGYARLARKINGEVAYMVSNCKLEAQADAHLHLVIADLLAAAAAMEGKAKEMTRRDGAIKVVGALDSYGKYFDDPDWKPIEH